MHPWMPTASKLGAKEGNRQYSGQLELWLRPSFLPLLYYSINVGNCLSETQVYASIHYASGYIGFHVFNKVIILNNGCNYKGPKEGKSVMNNLRAAVT